MAELHLHGSRAVIHDVLQALGTFSQVRSAAPGEFTRRAFEAGKLDLTEVEGTADLLQAQTQAQRRMALQQMEGSLRTLYGQWRTQLLKCLAYSEAFVDFGEDEHIDPEVQREVRAKVDQVLVDMRRHLSDSRRGETMRSGASIAIIGPPNAGKSTLMNWLANRKASIVSPIPGTTRDIVEVMLDIGGYPVRLADTAGIRATHDPVEAEGVAMAKTRSSEADLQICVFDSACDPSQVQSFKRSMGIDSKCILLLNKIDTVKDIQASIHAAGVSPEGDHVVPVSCQTGKGLDVLMRSLEGSLKEFFEGGTFDGPLLTRARHREHITRCIEYLEAFLAIEHDIVLAAEELRYAIKEVGAITDRVDVEQLLDVIFRDFCIGK
eukprot:TRINITY_DN5915_c0_g1_i3.p1 TRINITY_DN5915_c0_g1~~TRINITY_DN5915_c0_g1_i3.p1  ORF type:complete len:379 (+),score=87.46 TRINITY_DN5915_c0_g1_i3:834-1970(+)